MPSFAPTFLASLRAPLLLLGGALVGLACAAPASPEAAGSAGSQIACSSSLATNLASVASKMEGKSSGGKCYHYVKDHLREAGVDLGPVEGQVGAYEFGEWANANPDGLSSMGFEKITPSLDEIPKGSILVWPRGQCGYSAQYGHIEIVIDDDSSRACSDFCGRVKKDCGSPDIFAPKGCASGGASKGALEDDPASGVNDGNGDSESSPTRDDDTTSGDDDDSASAGSSRHGSGQTEECQASFYDEGQETASGERFNPDDLTAAHKTLPFNTMVRVTNKANHKTVDVRINDRGPFVKGRCLDLSRAAFNQISSESAGTADVSAEVLE